MLLLFCLQINSELHLAFLFFFSVNHAPKFTKAEYVFQLPKSADGYIGRIYAEDKDAPNCLQSARDPCECAHVRYSILKGNELNLFWINSVTGALFIEAENHVLRGDVDLKVEASDGRNATDVAGVFISFTGRA